MEGDTVVSVEATTVNYKDGLAITGKSPVVRHWPMIPGIDLAGTVESSTHPDWKPGDKVILNGWGTGETHYGAYAGKSRVKGDWLIALPEGMSATRRDGRRHGRLHGDAVRDGAGTPRHHAGSRPRRGDRRVGRRRLGRDLDPRQARLPRHRLDGPQFGGRLSEGSRRRGDHRPGGTFGSRAGRSARSAGRRRSIPSARTRSPTCWRRRNMAARSPPAAWRRVSTCRPR
jgi:hypothetical protein